MGATKRYYCNPIKFEGMTYIHVILKDLIYKDTHKNPYKNHKPKHYQQNMNHIFDSNAIKVYIS